VNKVETKFVRKGRRVFSVDGEPFKEFASINEAKAWSKKEQLANGGLGMGYVRVEKQNG
jgi:hypothetical protein